MELSVEQQFKTPTEVEHKDIPELIEEILPAGNISIGGLSGTLHKRGRNE